MSEPSDPGSGPARSTWQDELDAAEALEIRQLVTAAAAIDGLPALGGHVLEALGHGGAGYLLVRSTGSKSAELTAVAVAPPGDPAELVVQPRHRRQGIGRRLATAALDRSGAVWAHGDLPAARALAAALDLQRTRELLRMQRPLTDWTADPGRSAELPAGVRIRPFEPGRDEDDFLAVNARAFAWHPEQGRLDRAGLRVEMSQPWFDPAGFFLAEDDTGRLLGFHWTKVHQAAPGAEPVGEVYVLGVDPESPIRRLGAPLTAAGLDHLAALGLGTVILYVEGDNVPALRLYERLGFVVSSTDVVYRRR